MFEKNHTSTDYMYMYCNCTIIPNGKEKKKQIRKQNQPCKNTVLHVHRIHDQSMPMAMTGGSSVGKAFLKLKWPKCCLTRHFDLAQTTYTV